MQVLSARAASAFLQMMALGRVVPAVGGHVSLALLASVVGAVGAFLSVFAAIGVEAGAEAQVQSASVMRASTGGRTQTLCALPLSLLRSQVRSLVRAVLFAGGLVLQYLVTGFATGVAAPAISALGDSSVQGRLMGLHSAIEVGGRMGGQIIVALLYDIAPFYGCALPVVANVVAAASMALALVLEKRQVGK